MGNRFNELNFVLPSLRQLSTSSASKESLFFYIHLETLLFSLVKHNNYSWPPASFVSLSALLSTSTISAIDSEIKLTYKAFSKSSSKHWDKIWVCSLTRILEKSFHSGYTRANLKKLYFSFTDGAAISDQNWSHPFDLDLDLGRGSIARSRSAKSDQTIKSISISNRSPQVCV